MPYLTSTSFSVFLERITVGRDALHTAAVRGDAIARLLREHFDVLQVIPTGSLIRHTGLKLASDLDLMVVLHYGKHIRSATPTKLLQDVRDVLGGYRAQIVRKNGQAVTAYFETWPNVDVVPAARLKERADFEIPNAVNNTWIRTDPAAHDSLMRGVPRRARELSRMIKCWNHAHSEYFQSFHIEQVATQTTGIHLAGTAEDDWPYTVKAFFDKAIELTAPAAKISAAYELEEWSELRSRLNRGQTLSREAWLATSDGDHRTSIERLRILFGNSFPAYG